MTTIATLVCKDKILLATDSRVSTGNLKMPMDYSKITEVDGNIFLASTGSIAACQMMSRIAKRNIRVDQAFRDTASNISPSELANAIQELGWGYGLEYETYKPFGFILAGFDRDTGQLSCYSLDADGCKLHISNFWAAGSGGQLALSILSSSYMPDLSDEEAISIMERAIQAGMRSDLYSGGSVAIVMIKKDLEKNEIKVSFHSAPSDEANAHMIQQGQEK